MKATIRGGVVSGLFVLAFAGLETLAWSQESNEVVLGSPELTSGISGEGPLTTEQIKAWLANPANHDVLKVKLPLGLAAGEAQMVGLEENPLTRAKIELGRQLYYETRLSSDSTISCATCHSPTEGYASRTKVGVGVGNQEGGRNSPVSYNRILSGKQFWDGRAASLEEQAIGPIANPIEMGNTHDVAVKTLTKIPGYVMQFTAVFPDEGLNITTVAKAIASFERAIVSGPSPFDYAEEFRKYQELSPEELTDIKQDEPELYQAYLEARKNAQEYPMTESATRGRELFFSQRVNCAACHVGANLADELYHNLGVGMDKPNPDLGRYVVTNDPKDWGSFKTPTIRNVEFSAPYMHDGSMATLEEVVEHYDIGGTPNKNLSDKIFKLKLTEQESADLVSFMKACTGDFPTMETGRLPQ